MDNNLLFANNSYLQFKNTNYKKYSNEDYRFYKKRIYYLIKDILQKKNKEEEIIGYFDEFLGHAIDYLKFKDKSQIIQEEHINLNDKDCSNISIKELWQTTIHNKEEEGNMLLYNQHEPKVKTITQCMPITIKTNNKAKIHIPEKRNLEKQVKDIKWKTHGIIYKKNNNIIYENETSK